MIRPPKLEGAAKPICHLLLFENLKHVAYIPSIENYLEALFGQRGPVADMSQTPKDRRCPYCFALLADTSAKLTHIKSKVCHSPITQASEVRLPKESSVLPIHELEKTEAPVLTVIMDTESRLLTLQQAAQIERRDTAAGFGDFKTMFGGGTPLLQEK